MCKESAHSYCPTCDTYRPADHFTTQDGDPRHRCHGCGGLLVDAAPPGFAGRDIEILGRVVGFVARALIARGLMTALAAAGKVSADPAQVLGFAAARAILREAAKL